MHVEVGGAGVAGLCGWGVSLVGGFFEEEGEEEIPL